VALVTDIRELRRKRTIGLVKPPTPEQPQPVLLPAVERESYEETLLARLIESNPALTTLIDTLDLELVRAVLPPGHARLWDLAGQSLQGGITYTRAEAIEKIRTNTSVTEERAEKGFSLMIESRAIEPAVDALTNTLHPDLFYLGGSTPF
jgi:hypothetical protein